SPRAIVGNHRRATARGKPEELIKKELAALRETGELVPYRFGTTARSNAKTTWLAAAGRPGSVARRPRSIPAPPRSPTAARDSGARSSVPPHCSGKLQAARTKARRLPAIRAAGVAAGA